MRTAIALALFVSAGVVVAAEPGAPSVKAYALNVNNPPANAPKEIVSPPYTGAYLFVQVPGRHILALDARETNLALTDDKGTDLAAPKTLTGPAIPTDKTKEQARLYVLGSKAPAAGATRVRVKGELVLLCGTGEKTATAEKVAVKDGEKVTVGPAAFEVVVVKDKLSLVFKAESPAVKSVTFTGADGKPLAVPGTINLGTPAGKIGQTATFTLPAKTETVGIKVVHYEKVEPLKLPVDTDTGVGP
jgi:hypothetical protein